MDLDTAIDQSIQFFDYYSDSSTIAALLRARSMSLCASEDAYEE